MMEYQVQPLPSPSPQRTVMMLSGDEPDLSELLPRTYETSIDHRLGEVPANTSQNAKLSGMTLTPELVQQKLQTPRRVSLRISAFTSPARLIPTATAIPEGQLSFFSQVTDTSGLRLNDSFQSSQFPPSVLDGTAHHHALVTHPLEYISPATTPARSDTDASPQETVNHSFGDLPSSIHHIHPNPSFVDINPAGAVVPTAVTPVVIAPGVQPIHLVEQQREQLMLQREQELLQLQLQSEFLEEQRRQEIAKQNDEEFLLRVHFYNEFQNEMEEKKQEEVSLLPAPLLLSREPRSEEASADSMERNTGAIDVAPLTSDSAVPKMPQIVDHLLQVHELDKLPGYVDHHSSVAFDVSTVSHACQKESSEGFEEDLPSVGEKEENFGMNSTRYYSSPTESLTRMQQQCMDEMTAPIVHDVPESDMGLETPHLSTPSRCRDDCVTQRFSNIVSTSESYVSPQTDPDETYHLEPDHQWSAATVDAMKATMSRALGKLHALASHIAANSADSSFPEAMNTSTESSSASPVPDSVSSKILDFQDLADELRGTKLHDSEKTGSDEKSVIVRHRRRDSTTSFDSVGAPKPASLAHTSSPPRHLQKPIPLNPLTILPSHPIPLQKSDLDIRKIGPRYISPPVSSSRTRAVTPIVRMRHQGEALEEESAADQFNQSFEEMSFMSMAKTNRRVKSKRVKNGSRNRAVPEKPQLKKKSKPKSQKTDQENSVFSFAGQNFHVPAGIPTCKNDVIQMLERFMATRCGNLDDTYDDNDCDDDSSVDSNDPSFCTEEDKPLEREIASGRSKSSAVKVPLGQKVENQKENVFLFAEPKYAITVDVNDKQFIRQFIASATTEGVLLIRHKVNHKNSLRRPTKNLAQIKRGAPMPSGKFKGPSLMWNEINGMEEGELDLFDIRSLDKATALELENYPLAMPGRSMFLRLHKGNDYVFEARNEEDALRFVHGMRWLIARLAFNLIIGNVSVSCELMDVERSNKTDDRYGMFPSSSKEETQWTMAMNNTTSHLVSKASESFHHNTQP